MRVSLLATMLSGLALGLTLTAPAWAQDEAAEATEDSGAGETTSSAEGGEAAETTGSASAAAELKDPNAIPIPSEADDSPVEKPGQTYYFAGLRYRGIIVPKFMMNLFGDGGTTVYVDNIGPEFGMRKDNFEYVMSLSYADYGMDWTPFKGSSDPEDSWELVKSEMNVLYATVDFLWTTKVTPQFGINFGLGAGFGIVWGDLYRNEAYRRDGEFERCAGPGTHPDCLDDEGHYGDYKEPSWSDGGSKPIIFPWLAPMVGARYKFHRRFVARFDAGFGITGFFLGLGADYGL